MKWVGWILAGFAVTVSPAQQSMDSVAIQTLEECIAVALEHSPVLRQSAAREAGAAARASELQTQMLPTLRLTARAVKQSEVPEFTIALPAPIGRMSLFPSITGVYSARLTLQQPLFTGFRLIRSHEMASLQAEAAGQDSKRDQADLVFQVTGAYWNLVRAREIDRALRTSIAQMRGHLKDLNAFREHGMATDLDVQKVTAQLSTLEVRRIEAANAILFGSMQLNSLMGQPLDRPILTPSGAASADSSIGGLEREYEDVLRDALRQRPELRAMELRRDASAAGVGAARAGWFPTLFLTANYDYAHPNPRIIPQREQWDKTWDVGINLQWNIWDWLATSHQTTQAEAVMRQTEAAMVQARDAISLDVAQSYYGARAAQQMLAAARAGWEATMEAYRMTAERFKQGIVSSTDLLDSQSAAIQAEVTLTQARADFALASARLTRSLGVAK